MITLIIVVLILLATAFALAFRDDFPSILVWRTYLVFGGLLLLTNLGVVFSAVIDTLFNLGG